MHKFVIPATLPGLNFRTFTPSRLAQALLLSWDCLNPIVTIVVRRLQCPSLFARSS